MVASVSLSRSSAPKHCQPANNMSTSHASLLQQNLLHEKKRAVPSLKLAAMAMKELYGVRMSKLQAVLGKALDSTLRSCSFESFCQCFPTLMPENKELLFEIHTQLLHVISTHVQVL